LGLTQTFARRKFRGAYTISVVTQEEIATAYSLDGKVEPIKQDTGISVLRFSRRAELARFLRNSPPRANVIYRIHDLDLSGQNFRGAQLRQVEFTSCNFAKADFSDSTLKLARVKECNFNRTVFKNADLTSATLAHCNLTGADMRVRASQYLEMKWCTNPPTIAQGANLQPVYYTHPKYTGPHKIRGLIRKLS